MFPTTGASTVVRTFLFTDIEGSTRTWQSLPDGMAAALDRHDEILHGLIREHGGEVVKHTGDGLLAVFDAPRRAAEAAAAAQLALLELGEQVRRAPVALLVTDCAVATAATLIAAGRFETATLMLGASPLRSTVTTRRSRASTCRKRPGGGCTAKAETQTCFRSSTTCFAMTSPAATPPEVFGARTASHAVSAPETASQ